MTAHTIEIDIDFVSTEEAIKELNTSPATLRRVNQLLRKYLKRDFPHEKYEKGYTKEAYEIVKIYFSLRGKGIAPKRIAEKLRDRLWQ